MNVHELFLEFLLYLHTGVGLNRGEEHQDIVDPLSLLAAKDGCLIYATVTCVQKQNHCVHDAHQAHDCHNTEVHRRVAHVVDPDLNDVQESTERVEQNYPQNSGHGLPVHTEEQGIPNKFKLRRALNNTVLWRWTTHGAAWVVFFIDGIILGIHFNYKKF